METNEFVVSGDSKIYFEIDRRNSTIKWTNSLDTPIVWLEVDVEYRKFDTDASPWKLLVGVRVPNYDSKDSYWQSRERLLYQGYKIQDLEIEVDSVVGYIPYRDIISGSGVLVKAG
jgi:hypothetical protein